MTSKYLITLHLIAVWCPSAINANVYGYTPLNANQLKYFNAKGNVIDGNSKSSFCSTQNYGANKVCNCGSGNITIDIEPKISKETLIQKAEKSYSESLCRRAFYGEGRSFAAAGNCGSGTRRVKSIYEKIDKGTYWLIVTNGIPDHCHDTAQDGRNPNIACEQYRALIVPKDANSYSYISAYYGYSMMGPAGIASSGAFLFNHMSAEVNCNAAAVTEKATFDPCDGHSSPTKQYHYHKMPYPSDSCMPGGFAQCKPMGYMIDGVPLYTPCSFTDGTLTKSCYKLKDELVADTSARYGCDTDDYEYQKGFNGCTLDDANGIFFWKDTYSTNGVLFPAKTYAYFYSEEYPYIPIKYYGYGYTYWCQL